MRTPRMDISFARKINKTALFGIIYGAKDGWIVAPKDKPVKTAEQLANERWHTAEHIRANTQPTAVGPTDQHLTDDGDPDVYRLLTEFLFDRGAIQNTADVEVFPTYVVVSGGRLVPYDLENPGKENEELLVWI